MVMMMMMAIIMITIFKVIDGDDYYGDVGYNDYDDQNHDQNIDDDDNRHDGYNDYDGHVCGVRDDVTACRYRGCARGKVIKLCLQ